VQNKVQHGKAKSEFDYHKSAREVGIFVPTRQQHHQPLKTDQDTKAESQPKATPSPGEKLPTTPVKRSETRSNMSSNSRALEDGDYGMYACTRMLYVIHFLLLHLSSSKKRLT
jgi:hypothetical protein